MATKSWQMAYCTPCHTYTKHHSAVDGNYITKECLKCGRVVTFDRVKCDKRNKKMHAARRAYNLASSGHRD